MSAYKGYNHQGKCRHDQLSSPVKTEIRQQLDLLTDNSYELSFTDDEDVVDNDEAFDDKMSDQNSDKISINNANNNQRSLSFDASNDDDHNHPKNHQKSMTIDWPELVDSRNSNNEDNRKNNNKGKNVISFVAALLSPKKK